MSKGRMRWVAIAVVVVAFLFSGALIGSVGEAEPQRTVGDTLPEGYDSTTVEKLAAELPSGDDAIVIVLFTADSRELSKAQQKEIGALVPDPRALQVSEDGTAAIAVVPLEDDGGDEDSNTRQVEDLRDELSDAAPDGVTAQVTGPAAIRADLASVFDGADIRLLASTALVVAILLLITYRSPILWVIPLTVVGLADRVAVVLATHGLLAVDLPWNGTVTGILSVLVFGAGTDYALLLISRYRDELRTHESRYAAMGVALRGTAESVLASSTTVVLGLLSLLLSVVPTTRSLGVACAIGIVVAAVYALVVLPCALALFGRWAFWPYIPRMGQEVLADSRDSWWRRLGDRVATRPSAYAVGAVLLLAVLASGLFQVRIGLPEADQFLKTPESIAAAERLAESFPAGASDPVVVMTRDDAEQVAETASSVDGVDSARVTTQDDGLARLQVVLSAPPGSDEAADGVERLRDALGDYDETWVGGSEAKALDEAAASSRDQWLIIPLILGLVLVALLVLLRSIVAPVLLVATVVGTYFAALGASWWIFRLVFDFPAMGSPLPLYTFLFLVALGVDYNIFLVSRAAQESREHGVREGMLRALTATGGVITSAGILLAAVFAALGVLPLVFLAQIGMVIFVGVLLDTLLVRTILVPALALILGERFWWPRRVTART